MKIQSYILHFWTNSFSVGKILRLKFSDSQKFMVSNCPCYDANEFSCAVADVNKRSRFNLRAFNCPAVGLLLLMR